MTRASFLTLLFLILQGLCDPVASESPDDCLDVEHPTLAAPERQLGDYYKCISSDEVGMVCGWDGKDNEAYCEVGTNGELRLKVCARKRGNGRCDEGNNTPTTTKTSDKEETYEL